MGTLIAVFLSTSDEMIPILVAGSIAPKTTLLIIVYKTVVGILVGFAIDFILRALHKDKPHTHIGELCEEGGCHCERGIFSSALHHTLTVSIFVVIVSLAVNSLVFFIGEETLAVILPKIPVLSHLVCAVLGLIPSCASSVLLTKLALSGIISGGAMLSGLFSGAGVGILVLLRTRKKPRECALILLLLVVIGALFGGLFDIFLPTGAL